MIGVHCIKPVLGVNAHTTWKYIVNEYDGVGFPVAFTSYEYNCPTIPYVTAVDVITGAIFCSSCSSKYL